MFRKSTVNSITYLSKGVSKNIDSIPSLKWEGIFYLSLLFIIKKSPCSQLIKKLLR